MIPLNFALFWAGDSLSYLRYLTFKSLRYFHPDSKIKLYTSKEFNKNAHKWNAEGQDFEKTNIKNYLDKLKDLDIEVINLKYVASPDLCPIAQSDIFRFIWLRDSGGIYLDTDQIILKSFKTLPLDKEFIYCRYNERQCGDYLPVGVLLMEKGSPIADIIIKCIMQRYTPYDYNSSGVWSMRNAIKLIDLSKSFNSPYYYFYPINSSADVGEIYNGRFKPDNNSFCFHWYGGHLLSQEFNKNYTEDFSMVSNDSISVFLREKNII